MPAFASPSSDVPSIKASPPNAPLGGFGMSPSGLFQVRRLSLVEMIQAAYGSGLPLYRFQRHVADA